MITCKVFFNANIGIYVENRPYEVLIYVNFRGGVKGKMLFFLFACKALFAYLCVSENGCLRDGVMPPCNPLTITGFAKDCLLRCKRWLFRVR